ncbi:glycosyltransferase [Cytobacillus oceanisediminis]|uniref:Glycosyl transferase n=1 Tax=Cytobacillus oceanisediminis 2691 TaxID=1196031 RepID=A0A160MG34_9BACI|nr:glycosyltransferase [Cytobacillus oceanisediminis]AND41924.1 glycosyl transferase [Cytobacillus oceanisediminis 2691]MCS0826117.1 glycosyltransferase [Cytobacillus firmus]
MKKSVLFMLINMNVGGTEKALLNMISEMPREKFEITLLMLEKYGGFLDSIPSYVKVEYLKGYDKIKQHIKQPMHITALEFLKKGKFLKGFIIIFLLIISKITKEKSLYYRYILHGYPVLKNQYDTAVAYAGPMDLISYFIAYKIRSKRKIQWIHFDVNKIGFNTKFASKIYVKFDKIFVVSKEARKKLINKVPDLQDKSEVFNNIISPGMIFDEAKKGKGFTDHFDGLRILTVGRLSTEKGQDVAIKVLSRLITHGFKVKWYCLGEGSSREAYENLIEEYNLKDHFILLGADPNPYPYIKHCDIYVQPSRHEGYCITLAEARFLKKPIVTTDFVGATEQIRDGKTGLIVRFDENEIFNGVINLINNKDLCTEFSNNLSRDDFVHATEIKKLL